MTLRTDYALGIANACRATSDAIAARAASHERNKTFLDLLSVVLGLLAIVVELSPYFQESFGELASRILSTAAAALLVISVGIERTLFKDPPSRFRDYAYYIGSYAAKINSLLARDSEPDHENKVMELCALAENNLEEARRHWPELVRSA